jgi:hypothetical protein
MEKEIGFLQLDLIGNLFLLRISSFVYEKVNIA